MTSDSNLSDTVIHNEIFEDEEDNENGNETKIEEEEKESEENVETPQDLNQEAPHLEVQEAEGNLSGDQLVPESPEPIATVLGNNLVKFGKFQGRAVSPLPVSLQSVTFPTSPEQFPGILPSKNGKQAGWKEVTASPGKSAFAKPLSQGSPNNKRIDTPGSIPQNFDTRPKTSSHGSPSDSAMNIHTPISGVEGYLPSSQGYPPRSQGHPVLSQGYPPHSQAYLPTSQVYTHGNQVYPPSSQVYTHGSQGYPSSSMGYPPSTQDYLSGFLGHTPSTQGYSLSGQGFVGVYPHGYHGDDHHLGHPGMSSSINDLDHMGQKRQPLPDQSFIHNFGGSMPNISDAVGKEPHPQNMAYKPNMPVDGWPKYGFEPARVSATRHFNNHAGRTPPYGAFSPIVPGTPSNTPVHLDNTAEERLNLELIGNALKDDLIQAGHQGSQESLSGKSTPTNILSPNSGSSSPGSSTGSPYFERRKTSEPTRPCLYHDQRPGAVINHLPHPMNRSVSSPTGYLGQRKLSFEKAQGKMTGSLLRFISCVVLFRFLCFSIFLFKLLCYFAFLFFSFFSLLFYSHIKRVNLSCFSPQ